MKRLTEWFSNGQAGVAGCGYNCQHNYEHCADHCCPTLWDIYEKLARYEDTLLEPDVLMDAIEDGRLYILPCKLGAKVFRVVPDTSVTWPDPPEFKVICSGFKLSDAHEFGKTVFLTREEAEKVAFQRGV